MPHKEVIGDAELWLGDCMEILPTLPKVDAVITDPPYFGVKADEWDNQWDTEAAFLQWLGQVLDGCSAVMEPWSSIYVFTSPQMNWHVEGLVREKFNFLNSIRWVKPQGWQHKQPLDALRIFQQNWEGCLLAQKGEDDDALDASGYQAACTAVHKKVYAELGAYFRNAREQAGLNYRDIAAHIKRDTALYLRWEEGSSLPSEEDYQKCQAIIGGLNRALGDLRKEFDGLKEPFEAERKLLEPLRDSYEALRRPFKPFDARMRGDVWEYNCVTGYAGKHPCEKPLQLMSHITGTSTRKGQTVLDPFAGSGTTGVAAIELGRKFIGIEREPKYFDIACRRIEQAYKQRPLFEAEPVKAPEQMEIS
jgi:adenine-specific DNA-methyltransferase